MNTATKNVPSRTTNTVDSPEVQKKTVRFLSTEGTVVEGKILGSSKWEGKIQFKSINGNEFPVNPETLEQRKVITYKNPEGKEITGVILGDSNKDKGEVSFQKVKDGKASGTPYSVNKETIEAGLMQNELSENIKEAPLTSDQQKIILKNIVSSKVSNNEIIENRKVLRQLLEDFYKNPENIRKINEGMQQEITEKKEEQKQEDLSEVDRLRKLLGETQEKNKELEKQTTELEQKNSQMGDMKLGEIVKSSRKIYVLGMRKSTIDKIKGGENVEYTYKSAKKALLCFAAMTPAEEGGLLSEGKKRMLGRSRLWFKSPEKIRTMLSHAEKRFAPDPKDNLYVAEKKQKLLKELKDANNTYFKQKAKKYNDQIIK